MQTKSKPKKFYSIAPPVWGKAGVPGGPGGATARCGALAGSSVVMVNISATARDANADGVMINTR